MTNIVWVGLGGFFGSSFRYLLGLILASTSFYNLPFSTLVVNVLGAFALGCLMAIGQPRLGENIYLFLVPGLLGGFTTYSTYSGETFHLIRQELYMAAAAYVLITFIGGLAAVALGYYAVKSLS